MKAINYFTVFSDQIKTSIKTFSDGQNAQVFRFNYRVSKVGFWNTEKPIVLEGVQKVLDTYSQKIYNLDSNTNGCSHWCHLNNII